MHPRPRQPLLLLLLLLVGTAALPAQGLAGARNEDPAVLFFIGYGPFGTAADLADRFGGGFNLDAGVTLLAGDTNWEFGLRVNFGFGSQVKIDPLASIRTRDGFLIGNQRAPADIQLRHRQFFVGPTVGYTLPIGKNRRSGIHLKTSLGYFFSKIRFQDDPNQTVPQIADNLEAGYDRLAGGPALHQFVGYQQLSVDRRLNWYIGGELLAGFTRDLRSFNYDTGQAPPDAGRTDLVIGAKVGVILPFYRGKGEEIFYR